MIRSVFLLILVLTIGNIDCTIRIGYISNATYASTDITAVITYENTCSECICYGFLSSVPPLYVGLNCYKNTKMCALFANYSSPSTMETDLNSTFIFIQQPPLQNTITESNTSLTTASTTASPTTASTTASPTTVSNTSLTTVSTTASPTTASTTASLTTVSTTSIRTSTTTSSTRTSTSTSTSTTSSSTSTSTTTSTSTSTTSSTTTLSTTTSTRTSSTTTTTSSTTSTRTSTSTTTSTSTSTSTTSSTTTSSTTTSTRTSSTTITTSSTTSTTTSTTTTSTRTSTRSSTTSATTAPCINRFPTQVTYSTGSNSGPYPVTTADVNGDGKPDIIVTNYKIGTVGVFLNTGNGTFIAQVTYTAGTASDMWSIAAADVNGDSKPDIIVVRSISNSIGILFNTGSGTFGAEVTYSTGNNSKPYSVAAADVNGDGKLDIIVANYVSYTVGVFLNTGAGTFGAQVTYSVGTTPFSVAAADVNGDGKPDIIVANTGSDNVGVLLNTGTGTFGAQVTYSTGASSQPYSVVAVDVNGDGKPDIIVANYNSLKVGVLLNTGTGTFVAQVTYSTGSNSYPYYVVAGDINRDGYCDIIVANYYADNVGVFLNTGTGTFVAQVTYSTGASSEPYSVNVADVNGDGTLDIIAGNYYGNNIGVFLSDCS